MAFFFTLAAKEVFEATLPGGPLASPRRALSPLAAAIGGMVAPAVIYVALASTLGAADLIRGWAIPCATDIAFSAMIARVIFPGGHPAIPFLRLLAIADDALGLIILAVFSPSGTISFPTLVALMTAAVLLATRLVDIVAADRFVWPDGIRSERPQVQVLRCHIGRYSTRALGQRVTLGSLHSARDGRLVPKPRTCTDCARSDSESGGDDSRTDRSHHQALLQPVIHRGAVESGAPGGWGD